jgi:hypothetical protein
VDGPERVAVSFPPRAGERTRRLSVRPQAVREDAGVGDGSVVARRRARAAFADVWCAIPKAVFSRTLDSVQGNARLAETSLAEEIAAALDATDKDVSIGGAGLAVAAIELGLVHELRMVPLSPRRRWRHVVPAAGHRTHPAGPDRDQDVRLARDLRALRARPRRVGLTPPTNRSAARLARTAGFHALRWRAGTALSCRAGCSSSSVARARRATLRRRYPAPNAGVGSDAIGVPRSGSRRAPQRALRPVGLRRRRCPGNPGPVRSPSSERHAGRAHAGRGQRVPIRPLVTPAARHQGPRRAPCAWASSPSRHARSILRVDLGPTCSPSASTVRCGSTRIASDRRRVADVFRPLVGRTSGRGQPAKVSPAHRRRPERFVL